MNFEEIVTHLIAADVSRDYNGGLGKIANHHIEFASRAAEMIITAAREREDKIISQANN